MTCYKSICTTVTYNIDLVMPRRHGAKRRGLPQRGRRVLLDPAKDAGAAGQRGVIYRLTGAYSTLRTYTID